MQQSYGNYQWQGVPFSSVPFTSNIIFNPIDFRGQRHNSKYHMLEPDPSHIPATNNTAVDTDQSLKRWVRILKLITRLLNTALSAATLVPLLMTIVKFEQTKGVYFEVDGLQRTAWARDPITGYTFMYAGVSGVSFLLNFAVLVAYCCGVQAANRTHKLVDVWTWLQYGTMVVVWCASTALYRYGKEPVDGKFRDLWGWTCSNTAQQLQDQLTSVDFARYCTVQVSIPPRFPSASDDLTGLHTPPSSSSSLKWRHR